MRQKRAKAYKKLMSVYSMTFGFRQPYQVLVDAEMCKISIDHKIELLKQLGVVLQGEVKLMITQCCIHELYLQGKAQQSAVDLAKTFERRKCNHREAILGDDCLASVIGLTNKHRYVVATQSHLLRVKLRNIPAVPIVHVNRTVVVLEPPSNLTVETKNAMEEKALHSNASDMVLVGLSSTPTDIPRKRKKNTKGPNPLSIKKKHSDKLPTPKSKEKKITQSGDAPILAFAKRKREDEQAEDEMVPHKKRRRRRKLVNETTRDEANS